jgi:hypothetical protein
MFLIDILFKGCQGRSNRSLIVHAMSYFACGVIDILCIFIFLWHTIAVLHTILTFRSCSETFCACGVNDTVCIFKKFEYLREFEFIFEKALAP